jgi:hypothetical protein
VDRYGISLDSPIHAATVRSMAQADFAIIVLSELHASVLYEIGICDGLKKPMLIVIDPKIDVPAFIQTHLHIRGTLHDKEIVRLAIEKFVDEQLTPGTRPSRPSRPVPRSHASTNITDLQLSRIGELRHADPHQFEAAAFDLFSEMRLGPVGTQGGDRGVDLAIWSTGLSPIFGNPILIELKSGRLDKARLSAARSQMKKYLENSDAKLGLLLYLDRQGRRFPERKDRDPRIILYDYEDFLHSLRGSSFEEVILSARNELVEGGSE